MNPGIFITLLVLVSGTLVAESRTIRLTNSSPNFVNNNQQQLGVRPTAELKGQFQYDRASSNAEGLDSSKLFDGLTLASYGYDNKIHGHYTLYPHMLKSLNAPRYLGPRISFRRQRILPCWKIASVLAGLSAILDRTWANSSTDLSSDV